MDLKKGLNTNQYNAVTTTEGPLLIFAGAGSGKTRVITYRIAHLILDKSVPPWSIMAVTFTNKAAAEMKNRISSIIGGTGEHVFVKTFHATAVYILRRHGNYIDIPSSFSIYDAKDQEAVIKELLLEMKIDPKKYRPKYLASQISEIKDKVELNSVQDTSLLYPDNYPFSFDELYKGYQKKLKIRNALDFNDLLIKTVHLLRDCPEILEKLQSKWQYFMIDEYQDTNQAQYLISKYLAKKSRNICVVGDDDQSIYSWRGADIRNILDFEKDYPDAKVVKLEENYRSVKPILDAAAAVIINNIERKEKKLISCKGDGEAPVWCQANNEYGEAEFVVNSISSLKSKEILKNKDFAIFYRTNAQSRIFEEFLRKEDILYKIIGGLKFYDRKEIKDIASYLRFIVNPFDTVALMRIINTPARGIGNKTIEKLRNQAYLERMSEWEIIDKEIPIDGKIPKGIPVFKKIIIEGMLLNSQIPAEKKLSDLVTQVITDSGIQKNLEDENSLESKARLENIDEFINSIFEYESDDPDGTLEQFLQEISLLTSEDIPQQENENDIDPTNVVTLMTVHNAKGLEFPVVYLTGMEEGTFPHFNSSDSEEGIEEERRLCYVGITRAMQKLYLSSAEFRRSYSGIIYKEPSRFILEIPEESLEIINYQDSSSGFNNYTEDSFSNNYAAKNQTRTSSLKLKSNPAAKINADSQYALKDRVNHPKYGNGRVVDIEGKGDNVKLTIVFDSAGLKSFLEKYTPLQKI